MPTRTLEDDPLWFKDAIIYQLHIKAFYDSNGDGIGDFRGLLEKLDYLAELGVNTIWLLPFYPSPLRDDGYDIADYFGVNPDYGNIQDVREFLREAHRRGLRVITELVMNHTSDEHEWFQRARRAKPGTAQRNFYVWSDDPKKYADARIIFKDFELSNWTFDPVAQSNYWHRFYFHQPDLNFDNPLVHKAMFRVLDYWMALGVDGLRLDAVPYLYEREGTNCENLTETHEFLKKVREHIDHRFRNRMLLAEANQWPEDAAQYFGLADECHMNFHFPLMPRIYMALQMEDRFPIIDILEQTPAIPESCQWGIFLRNHDELTLEMVTDEERDYMYRVYAKDPKARINLGIRRRLAPLLNNNRYMIEIMNVLLLTLPGTPIIYYGDEIGMGDNYYLGDRNGVRTPMQWSPDRNAGFSKTNPQKLYLPVIIDPEYHYESVNVENQMRNPSSLLWWMRHMITTRKRFKAFGRGTIEFLRPDNTKILAYIRRYEDDIILVVMNLSRYSQFVDLDLSQFAGLVPEVVFSRTKFPVIKETPYRITLGMYGYFIFHLTQQEPQEAIETERRIPELPVQGGMRSALTGGGRKQLEQRILPAYIRACRWFGGKGKVLTTVQILEEIPIVDGTVDNRILLLRISYGESAPELYLLPLGYVDGERRDHLIAEMPKAVICTTDGGTGILFDAIYDESFRLALFKLLVNRKRLKTSSGEVVANAENGVRKFFKENPKVESSVLKIEHSNTAVRYGNSYFLKLYRKLEEGINPDAEIVQHLTTGAGYMHVPSFRGDIEFRQDDKEPVVMALLQDFVPNEGDAWSFTLDNVSRYFVNVYARRDELGAPPCLPGSLLRVDPAASSDILREMIGEFYLETVVLLGKRTAEMHAALATPTTQPAFAAEPFSLLYQRSVYQSMRSLTAKTLQALAKRLDNLEPSVRAEAEKILGAEGDILEYLGMVKTKKFSAMKTRVHGDYHLGQVLFTGKDFIIIDFEGEPARPLGERRLKRSPFKDVAGMIRSFHYAAYHSILRQQSFVAPDEVPLLEPWADFWYHHVSAVYLHSYLEHAKGGLFLPDDLEEREVLLNVFLLEKAIYELGYEMNNRPEWMPIPIRGVMNILRGCEE